VAALAAARHANATGLTTADVERIITQAVVEAEHVRLPVAIAVVDREGNRLGGFRMQGVCPGPQACDGPEIRGHGRKDGSLEDVTVPAIDRNSELGGIQSLGPFSGAMLAAISKAGTAAFFSTRGNAFSTRTAGFIIQQHFPPGVSNTASGPLFGVQFSQLLCSDITGIDRGLPLGLSADPGGLPLYKEREAVGGVGVEGNGAYTLDFDPSDKDVTREERIAVAATRAFAPPREVQGDRIFVGGLRLPFRNSGRPPRRKRRSFDSLSGVREIMPRDSPPSILRSEHLGGVQGAVLTDVSRQDRFFPPVDGTAPAPVDGGLVAADVRRILAQAARQADRTRAAIRRPLGDRARVNIAVVDGAGNVLGLFRTEDAPIFGIDVSVQKARSVALFSSPTAREKLLAEGQARAMRFRTIGLGGLVDDKLTPFVEAGARDGIRLDGAIAFSDRAIGFLSRPFFPDGIDGTQNGPYSRSIPGFSIFNDGLQLELVREVLLETFVKQRVPHDGCTRVPGLANGLQIFPGGVPLFRGRRLVGAIGISGDGVDQDDIVSAAGSVGFEAPPELRTDRVMVRDVRLPFLKFPRRGTTR